MKKVFLIVVIFIIAGASIKSIIKAEPLQTPPYAGMRWHPEPDAVNVSLDTSISLYYGRVGFNETAKIDMKPEVEIGNVTIEREHGQPPVGATFTFYPAKPLRPNTKYNVTVTTTEDGGLYPHSYSWQFTTETAKTPRAVPGFGIAITVMAIFLGISRKYLGKR